MQNSARIEQKMIEGSQDATFCDSYFLRILASDATYSPQDPPGHDNNRFKLP
jgi:hypothetical protein